MERQAEAWAQQGRSCLQDGEDGQEAQGIGVWRVCWLWSGRVMGGLLLQDMRSFGRATWPDLSLGLQSPPTPSTCPACLFGPVLPHHDRPRDSGSRRLLDCRELFVRALQIRPSKRRIPNTQMLCQFPQEVLSQPRIPVDS